MSEENKDSDNNDWIIGLILLGCILSVFYGLSTSNWTQILGGLIAFCVFSIWYSGLIKSLIELKVYKQAGVQKK